MIIIRVINTAATPIVIKTISNIGNVHEGERFVASTVIFIS